jgi:hypothetical protein
MCSTAVIVTYYGARSGRWQRSYAASEPRRAHGSVVARCRGCRVQRHVDRGCEPACCCPRRCGEICDGGTAAAGEGSGRNSIPCGRRGAVAQGFANERTTQRWICSRRKRASATAHARALRRVQAARTAPAFSVIVESESVQPLSNSARLRLRERHVMNYYVVGKRAVPAT